MYYLQKGSIIKIIIVNVALPALDAYNWTLVYWVYIFTDILHVECMCMRCEQFQLISTMPTQRMPIHPPPHSAWLADDIRKRIEVAWGCWLRVVIFVFIVVVITSHPRYKLTLQAHRHWRQLRMRWNVARSSLYLLVFLLLLFVAWLAGWLLLFPHHCGREQASAKS